MSSKRNVKEKANIDHFLDKCIRSSETFGWATKNSAEEDSFRKLSNIVAQS